MAGLKHTTLILTATVLAVSLFGADAMRHMKTYDKHDYTVEVKSVKTLAMSPEYFHDDSSMSYSMYNETQMTINAQLNLKKDIPADMMILILAIKKDPMTNQWVEKGRLSNTLCDFFEKSSDFIAKFLKDSDFPRKCPMTKGSYYIRNGLLDNSELPKHIDEAEWRGEVNVYAKTPLESMAAFTVFVEVESIDE